MDVVEDVYVMVPLIARFFDKEYAQLGDDIVVRRIDEAAGLADAFMRIMNYRTVDGARRHLIPHNAICLTLEVENGEG